jgi:GH24 family phage-related lysozyme (muramidase)
VDLSKKGYCELALSESLALQVYLDSGNVRTVSIGLTTSDIPDLNRWDWQKKITIEEAVLLYKKAIGKYVYAVNKAVTKLDIPQHQFDALVSLCYNIGVTGLATSTVIKRVNDGFPVGNITLHRVRKQRPKTTPGSVLEALCRFVIDDGVVVEGLINRREHEALLFRDGTYQNTGYVGVYKVNPITHKPSHDYNIFLPDYL